MKILVALDSSNYASEILKNIVGRTWGSGAHFRIISVVRETGNPELDQELVHQTRTILDERVSRMQNRLEGKATVEGEILTGDARSSIVQEARDWKADLIVLGSHGDTGVRPECVGSVASGVVHDAPCSVEVVKLVTSDELKAVLKTC